MTSNRVYAHHSFMYLWIVGAVLVLGGLGYSYVRSHPAGVIDGQHEGDVRTTVSAFGNQLNRVSLLSPTAAEDIEAAYAPYVTPELLALWVADPQRAPGRMTSSPWPDHIDIDSVTLAEAGSYAVAGRIMLVTSPGDAGSVPVRLTVSDVGGSYLISRYEEESGAYPAAALATTTVTVALNETAVAGNVSITPLEVVEDSRCPKDVQCIQAGTVRLSVRTASGLGESEMVLTQGIAMTTEAEIITLTDAVPEKMSTAPVSDAAYRFTFEVVAR